MNGAVVIAKYIVSKCYTEGCPVSNLKLQKILYYIQREFLQNLDEPAFPEEIEAWRFGPVVRVVYNRFCGYGSMPIRANYSIQITANHKKKEMIDRVVMEKRVLNTWDLVEATHEQGKPWALIFKNGAGDHQIIPNELIKRRG